MRTLSILLMLATSHAATAEPDVGARPALASAGAMGVGPPASGQVPGARHLRVDVQPSAIHCGGYKVSITRVPKAPATGPFERAMMFRYPSNLDFEKSRRRSMQRFEGWIRQTTELHAEANRYLAVEGDQGPLHRVESLARAVQLRRRFGEALARTEIPADVRRGPHAAAKMTAYCEAMQERAIDVLSAANDGAAECRSAIDAAAVGPGWWQEVCRP